MERKIIFDERKNNMINVAIVGVGSIGIEHIEAVLKVSKMKLCALCDVNEELVRTLAKENGVPYFTDYRDIPGAVKTDAVIINLPHFLHCESTVFFLENGINVFVEKPMANTVEECNKMTEAAKKNNVKLAVGHIQRFFEHNIRIKELINSGKLGKFCMYTESRNTNYFSPDRPKWFLDKEKAGGGISMNYGAHSLDKLFNIFGAQNVEVSGSLGNLENNASIEGHAQFLVKFSNSTSAAITFDGYADIPSSAMYYFTNGAISLIDNGDVTYRTDGDWIKLCEASSDIKDGMVYQLEEFCKFLMGQDSLTPDGEYGKYVISAISRLY